MSRPRIDFLDRKRSAEDTALWIMADVHKAQSAGQDFVNVKAKDLVEVLSYISALKHRDSVEYAGKHLGYARPDDMLRLKQQKIRGLIVMVKKGEKYNMPVSFVGELPETPVAKPVKVLEDSPC